MELSFVQSVSTRAVPLPDSGIAADSPFVFEGGGHVNRFTFEQLISEVETRTGLSLVQNCPLYSSFIYLHRPTEEEVAGYPRKAHVLAKVPLGLRTYRCPHCDELNIFVRPRADMN